MTALLTYESMMILQERARMLFLCFYSLFRRHAVVMKVAGKKNLNIDYSRKANTS